MTREEMEKRLGEVRRTFGETACAFMTANPRWAKELDEAPSAAKRFVRALFVRCLLEWIGTTDDEWRQITSDMDDDNWRYLAQACGNRTASAHYLQYAERIRTTHRPVVVRGCEILNPFADLPEGGAA